MKKLFCWLVFLLPVWLFAQTTGNVQTKIAGRWLLVKHTLTEKREVTDLLTSDETYAYNFSTDGNYEVSYASKKTNSTTVYKGKWKIISKGKKLKLFDSHVVPADSTILVGEKLLPIIRLTSRQFVTKELLFGMDLLGTSYYKKQ